MGVLERLQLANAARNAEWDPKGQLTPLFFATELAGEIGEACNIVKKIERAKFGLRGTPATLVDLAQELADGVIVISLLANAYHIDLPTAVREKFNYTSRKLGLSIEIEDLP
jgi:NTP pyrophosphatase (non-canonical NTP hydrolase)